MIHSDATLEEGLLRPRMCPGTCEPGDPGNGHHLGDRYLGSRLTLMLKTSWPELWDTRHEDWSGPHFLTLPGTAPYHVFSTFPARGGHPCLHSSGKPSRTAHPHKPLQVPHSDSIPHPVTSQDHFPSRMSLTEASRAGQAGNLFPHRSLGKPCVPGPDLWEDRSVAQMWIQSRSRIGGTHTQLFHSPGATSVKTCFCKTTAVAAGMRTETRSQGCRPEGDSAPHASPTRTLTQQQAVTVIWMVLRPGWHTCLRCRGLWEVLLSPRSMVRGVAFTLTCTEAGQLVFICRSSWW